MAILANQTLVGSVGRVYDLRTVGKDNLEVIDFSVAVTPRKKVNGEWTDGDTYWITVTAWGRLAKNVAESFNPGDRVFVIGRTEMKSGYTNKDGQEVAGRPILIADFAGLEVSFDPAHSEKKPRENRGGSSESPRREAKAAPKTAPKAQDDDFDLDLDDDDEDGFVPF